MVIRISMAEIEAKRREIINRGKEEAPGECVIEEEESVARPPLPEQPSSGKSPLPPLALRSPTEQKRAKALADRLLEGRVNGARDGKHQSGPVPYGYKREGRERNLVPEPQETEVVRLIFRDYLRLRSMKRLISFLAESNIRTRRGLTWSRAGVSWILKNDTYIGRVHFGAVRARGIHEAIVAPIIFHKVQKLIRLNDKRADKTPKPEAPPAPSEPVQ